MTEVVERADVLAEANLRQIEGQKNIDKFKRRQMHSVEKALGVVFISQQV